MDTGNDSPLFIFILGTVCVSKYVDSGHTPVASCVQPYFDTEAT